MTLAIFLLVIENGPELAPRQSLLLLVWARCFQALGLLPKELKNKSSHRIAKESRHLFTLNKAIVQSKEYTVKNNRGHRSVFSGPKIQPRTQTLFIPSKGSQAVTTGCDLSGSLFRMLLPTMHLIVNIYTANYL